VLRTRSCSSSRGIGGGACSLCAALTGKKRKEKKRKTAKTSGF